MKEISRESVQGNEYEEKTSNVCTFCLVYLGLLIGSIVLTAYGHYIILIWVIFCPIQMVAYCCLSQAKTKTSQKAKVLTFFFYHKDEVQKFKNSATKIIEQNTESHQVRVTVEYNLNNYEKVGIGALQGFISYLFNPLVIIGLLYYFFACLFCSTDKKESYQATSNTQTTQNA